MPYTAKKTTVVPAMDVNWNAPVWANAETAELTFLRRESSDHCPKVQVRLLHDDNAVYGIYHVEDRYVIAVKEGYQQQVCEDSCCEFFFKPSVGPGYFNLEMSADAAYLFYYIRNHTRTPDGFIDYTQVPYEHGSMIQVKTDMPARIYPEITTPVTWNVQFMIPKAALEPYTGTIDTLNGQTWHCNFYKCAGKSSHPHWLTWRPLPVLNYHLPECFDQLILE